MLNCKKITPLLSVFIDDRLSARDTFEVDRHLNECRECAKTYDLMKRTVEIVSSAPRFDAPDDFAVRLQARLETIQPAPARNVWLQELGDLFRPRLLPAWGAAVGACALTLVMIYTFQPPVKTAFVKSPSGTDTVVVQQARVQNVALAASSPLEDVSVANLAAHSAADTEGEPDKSD